MTSPFESSETFTAYATVSAGYMMIEEISKSLNKIQSPIEMAIDKVTGYDRVMMQNAAKDLIPILEDIISAKKVLKEDYSNDETFLNKCIEITNP